MATAETIATVLKEIAAAYPKFMADEASRADVTKVWAIYLADIPDDLLVVAVRKFISSSDHAFAPSIPEIRKAATSLRIEINGIPTSYEAWDEVLRAPKPRPAPLWRDGKIVEEEPYKWSHEIVYTVARRLGWPRFPDDTQLMADRSHFLKAYEAELSKATQQETRIKLVDEYIGDERQLMQEEQRRAALDTGEREHALKQMNSLARRMS
jgi:hypothetical protein